MSHQMGFTLTRAARRLHGSNLEAASASRDFECVQSFADKSHIQLKVAIQSSPANATASFGYIEGRELVTFAPKVSRENWAAAIHCLKSHDKHVRLFRKWVSLLCRKSSLSYPTFQERHQHLLRPSFSIRCLIWIFLQIPFQFGTFLNKWVPMFQSQHLLLEQGRCQMILRVQVTIGELHILRYI